MAEAVVSLAIERISDLLFRGAVFLAGVNDEVERLQRELKSMKCFLKDADLKQHQDERVRNWVAGIRDMAYDVEDVIDNFILRIAGGRSGGFIEKLSSIFTKGPLLHKTGKKIKFIRENIKRLTESLDTYGIKFAREGEGPSSASKMQQELRRTYAHYQEDYVITHEGTTNSLMAQLLKEEDRLRIVSIVGMGGLGKTTLAKKEYNHVNVKRYFDCYSWAFISQNFSTKDVLLGILKEVVPVGENKESLKIWEKMKEAELVKTLYNMLKEKRYLVVLDDIWRNEAWDRLKQAFPKGKKGSKVLFTTRAKDVALYADPG